MSEKISQFFIRLVMLGRPLLRSFGVDPYQLRVILQTKCTVDDRRPRGLNMYRKSRKSSGWAKNIGFLFIGGFISVLLFLGSPLLAHSLYITVIMIYATASLITDFSNVLIDLRDHYFIVTRPVNDATVAAARILHILIYLAKTFIPLFLAGILVVFIKDGVPAGLLFLVELASATTISIFAVNIIYMGMLQFMNPQRFRDILAYFQIGFSILIFGSYMIFPRLIGRSNIQHIHPLHYSISYFFPPVWIAALQNWARGIFTPLTYGFTALAIIAPVLCLAAIVAFLSGDYNSKLSLMGGASQTTTKTGDEAIDHRLPLSDRLAPWFCFSPLDELGFKITWKLTSRMNKFKSRVYPSFAFIPLYFFYWAFEVDSEHSLTEIWQHLPQTAFYLFLLYSIGYLAIVIIRQITRSERFKAAWFYQISPTDRPGLILAGMIKAIFVKYLLPLAIIFTAFILWIWGPAKWLNILFALINLLLITVVMALLKARKFPFSEPSSLDEQKGQRFLNIFLILIPIGLGYFQSFIAGYTLILIILSVLYAGITWALYRVYKNISWDDLLGDF